MNVLIAISQFIVNEILSVPAYLIGIITAVGLIALRKSAGQVVGGAIKAVLGFLLISAGATLVTASLDPLGTMIQGALGAQGVVPTNEAIVGIAQEQFGAQVRDAVHQPDPDPVALLDDVYAEPTPDVRADQRELAEWLQGGQ